MLLGAADLNVAGETAVAYFDELISMRAEFINQGEAAVAKLCPSNLKCHIYYVVVTFHRFVPV